MLVVADSSPLQYLVLIGHVDILPTLFGDVVIPGQVARELNHPKTPSSVREYMANPPNWLRIKDPRDLDPIAGIDPGEQAAISLAQELRADLLLIDDLDGRRAALVRGIPITGTLGILDRAAEQGLIDLRRAIEQLQATSMHLAESLLASLLARYDPHRTASDEPNGGSFGGT